MKARCLLWCRCIFSVRHFCWHHISSFIAVKKKINDNDGDGDGNGDDDDDYSNNDGSFDDVIDGDNNVIQ